jgi:hypothetical protein
MRNTTIEFIKDRPTDVAAYAKEKNYDYIIVSSLKFTRLELTKNFYIFSFSDDWKTEGDCTVKIYDSNKKTEIFNQVSSFFNGAQVWYVLLKVFFLYWNSSFSQGYSGGRVYTICGV